MNTNLKILLYSLVVGIAHVSYILSRPECEGDGLGCLSIELGPIIVGIIFIPIVFGIFGFVLSKERRFIRAVSWLGISFVVIFLLNIIVGQYQGMKFREKYLQTEVQTLPSDSPQRKIPLPTQ